MRNRSWRLRAALFAGLAILLVWLVISKSYVAYLADVTVNPTSDRAALDPADFLSLAEKRLHARPVSPSEPSAPDAPNRVPAELGEQARAQTVTLLRREPLNARALRILGEIADGTGDAARAAALMQAALHRSLHESAAASWILAKSFEQGDFATAAYYADALLRTRPQLIAVVTPLLARMAENKDANAELEKLLAGNPPWRQAFFSALPTSISDARTPLDLLLSLRASPAPPAIADLQTYLSFLISHKFYEVAYYAWLQFLPPEQLGNVGFLYNGSFETEPSKLPFDWVIASGSGVTIDIAPKPGEHGQRALFIEFGYGRVSFGGVTQFLVLAPGAYKLQAKYKGEIMGRRGLVWRITCAGGAIIGQSSMVLGMRPTWKEFDFAFTVPNRDCRAQQVSLVLDARSASEQFVSGSIWYDDLQISRIQAASAAQTEQH